MKTWRVRVGRCPEGRNVTIGGFDVGEISMTRKNAKAIPAALIDAAGGNCYRSVLRIYKEKGTPGFRNSLALPMDSRRELKRCAGTPKTGRKPR